MDEDGTLYVVNEGYILALRPLMGDFDGDGCRNNFDIDPFVEALLAPLTWDANYGAPIGINLLGVGDCNNDGVFNNFDIDCFVELIECCNNCGESGGGDSPSGPSSESGSDPQWEYFYMQIDWLRQIYGMDAP